MSHKATNWAVEQRGLKPTAKVVLWHLADRHNPDHGCFPSQDRLAADCEISRSNVNVQLNTLEAAGLIKRQPRIDPKTKRQLPTRYVLAFEADFEAIAEPCPETGHGAVSRNQAEPCPENEESRVQNLDTNLVREPLREPCVSSAAFERFWKVHPRPKNRDICLEKFKAAVGDGVSPDWIVSSAERYAAENAGNKPMYVAQSDNWLDQRRWTDFREAEESTGTATHPKEGVALLWAKTIKRGGYVPSNAIGLDVARLMIDRGMVTADQLRVAGVSL